VGVEQVRDNPQAHLLHLGLGQDPHLLHPHLLHLAHLLHPHLLHLAQVGVEQVRQVLHLAQVGVEQVRQVEHDHVVPVDDHLTGRTLGQVKVKVLLWGKLGV